MRPASQCASTAPTMSMPSAARRGEAGAGELGAPGWPWKPSSSASSSSSWNDVSMPRHPPPLPPLPPEDERSVQLADISGNRGGSRSPCSRFSPAFTRRSSARSCSFSRLSLSSRSRLSSVDFESACCFRTALSLSLRMVSLMPAHCPSSAASSSNTYWACASAACRACRYFSWMDLTCFLLFSTSFTRSISCRVRPEKMSFTVLYVSFRSLSTLRIMMVMLEEWLVRSRASTWVMKANMEFNCSTILSLRC
mmetsp:Transcript_100840/g.283352  ORF Transcript_100840/g.283352 Transcript_100840/m.283352 type:complete len:252 (-) Transcript_100840:557-1312(-)